MAKIRTAVVGLNLGKSHAHAYRMAEHADLRYVVDLNEEAARKLAAELDCGYASDWLAILDEVDAISICTPHHLHAEQTLKAISAGKHVLLEKPLATSREDCHKVLEAAERQGVTLMMAYPLRYMPLFRRLKEVIKSEQFGKPFNASCWIESYLQPRPGSWFADKQTLGGGSLFSHGCHYIDLLIWLFGKPVKTAFLGTRNGTEWMEGEGTSHSTMKFEGGALAHLVCSWGMKFASPPALFHIHTPEALISLSGGKLEAITAEGRSILFQNEESEEPKIGGNMLWEVNHFLECILSGKQPETDGHNAMLSLEAIWSMYAADEATA
ncbi:Gfo/Idh/MocA family protein [Paenibacillus sp. MBLB4367]|uniref:Gfo/Idh/MocA family protein n=1 Tax=Paenibacillus sp. MBLB4367 TaxID=3384767 RepID=UPI0039082B27